MPTYRLESDDDCGRRACVDPRDGRLKDTEDFAKDPKDFARESEERIRDRVEPEEREYDRAKNQAVAEQWLKEQSKSSLEKVSDKLFGSTKESCLKKEKLLEENGGDMTKKLTAAFCGVSVAQQGTNSMANILCKAGVATTVATEYGCQVWKDHCETLPSDKK